MMGQTTVEHLNEGAELRKDKFWRGLSVEPRHVKLVR